MGDDLGLGILFKENNELAVRTLVHCETFPNILQADVTKASGR